MSELWFLLGAAISGAVVWWFASQRTADLLRQNRLMMNREIIYWQERAERATAEMQRLANEKESWSAGCKQGREDVISIVPLLVAAQQRPPEFPAAAQGRESG
jgi:predicted  nucleic acid-binding Zn-ribbon protein